MADPAVVTWGTFAIAVIGVAQPHVYNLWRRCFYARAIDVYESYAPDIGFGPLGPVVGAAGTLKNCNAPSLIKQMTLRVTPADGGEGRTLTALLARERKISNDGGGREVIEGKAWAAFEAERDAAYQYDVLFADTDVRTKLEAIGRTFHTQWIAYAIANVPGQPLTPEQQAVRAVELFNQAKNQAFYTAARDAALREVFWRAGDFRLTIEIRCAEDTRTFAHSWDVTLTDDDVNAITANIDILLGLTAEIPPQALGQLAYAYPVYRPVAGPTVLTA